MKKALPIKGHVKIWQGDSLLCEGNNLVVADGMLLLAERLMDGTTALPSLFKLGDSAALSNAEMTSLQGTILASFDATVSRIENILKWNGNYTYMDTAQRTCREVGLFQSDSAGGRMLARFIPLQQFVIKSEVPLRINWEITIGE